MFWAVTHWFNILNKILYFHSNLFPKNGRTDLNTVVFVCRSALTLLNSLYGTQTAHLTSLNHDHLGKTQAANLENIEAHHGYTNPIAYPIFKFATSQV